MGLPPIVSEVSQEPGAKHGAAYVWPLGAIALLRPSLWLGQRDPLTERHRVLVFWAEERLRDKNMSEGEVAASDLQASGPSVVG